VGKGDTEQPERRKNICGNRLSALPWLLVVLLAALSGGWYLFRSPKPSHSAPLTAALVSGTSIDNPVISPDGKMIAFEDGGKLWVRSMDQLINWRLLLAIRLRLYRDELRPKTADGRKPADAASKFVFEFTRHSGRSLVDAIGRPCDGASIRSGMKTIMPTRK
jgi:hypothetical protein